MTSLLPHAFDLADLTPARRADAGVR